MSNPPSPSPPPSPSKPLLLPPPTTNPATATAAKPVPWTHEETVHLIQTYQNTWYSLNRTHLRSQHWDTISAAVASLCSYPPSHHSLKSPSQCRHKMEKLRKRYRSDRRRILQGTLSISPWPYYDLMDSLERGPLPINAVPVKARNSFAEDEEDDREDEDEEEEGEEEERVVGSRSRRVRSVDYILRRAGVVNRFAVAGAGNGRARVRVSGEAEEGEEKRKRGGRGEEGEEKSRREKVMRGLAVEIRGLAEKYVGVEEVKMEMVRETERWRMDMEKKRLDLILESQRKLVDAIARAFAS